MSDQETPDTQQNPDELAEEEAGHEETEPETDDGQEVEPPAESEAASEGEQAGATTTAPLVTTPGAPAAPPNAQTVAWRESPNEFDESTVEIGITLHPLKGRPPEERLVTFCIHNHSGPPVTNYYTQGELTDQSPLDRLLWAIAQEIKKFRAELSRRKQEQFEREEQAKRSRREQRSASPARTTTPTSTTPTPAMTPVRNQEVTGESVSTGVQQVSAPSTATTTVTTPTTTTTMTPSKPARKLDGLEQQSLF